MARVSRKELSLLASRLSDITGRNLLIESCYGWYNLNDYTDSKNGGCRLIEGGLTAREMKLFLWGALTGTGFMKK